MLTNFHSDNHNSFLVMIWFAICVWSMITPSVKKGMVFFLFSNWRLKYCDHISFPVIAICGFFFKMAFLLYHDMFMLFRCNYKRLNTWVSHFKFTNLLTVNNNVLFYVLILYIWFWYFSFTFYIYHSERPLIAANGKDVCLKCIYLKIVYFRKAVTVDEVFIGECDD